MVDTFVPASPSVMPYFEGIRDRLIDAVMALLSAEPAPPLWTGRTMAATHRNSTNTADVTIPGASVVPPLARLPVPPGTAVEVVRKPEVGT